MHDFIRALPDQPGSSQRELVFAGRLVDGAPDGARRRVLAIVLDDPKDAFNLLNR